MNQIAQSLRQEFVCQNVDHSNEPIIGFCFNQECSQSSQVCFKCLTVQHGKHYSDCLRFSEIQTLIQGQLSELEQLAFLNEQAFTRVQSQKCNNDKFLNQQKTLLTNLMQNIIKEEFGFIRSELATLKQWRQINEGQVSKNNQIFIKFEEVRKFSENINDVCDKFQIDKVTLINPNPQPNRQTHTEDSKELSLQSYNQGSNIKQIAKSLYHLKKYDEAFHYLELSLTQNQDNYQSLFLKGIILNKQNKHEEAFQCVNKSIQLNPSQSETIYFLKGDCLFELNKFEEAICCFDIAILMKSNEVKYHQKKALALSNLKKYQDAIVCFNKALQLEPNSPEILIKKGSALNQLGLYNEELQCYESALKQSPNSSNIWLIKGKTLFYLHKYPEAAECFKKVMELSPDQYQSYFYMGLCLQNTKQHLQAIAYFEKSYKLQQNNQTLQYKAQSLTALGRNDEALKIQNQIQK